MDNGTKYAWLDMAKRMQALAQSGLEYSDNKYDRDRYQQLRQLSLEIMQDFTDMEMEKLVRVFAAEQGYQTPKVDVRGVVFRGDQILMVRETIDGNWSLPGGWADVGHTPSEVAIKEVWEESGLVVVPERLLAVLDKKMHNHPRICFIFIRSLFFAVKQGENSRAEWKQAKQGSLVRISSRRCRVRALPLNRSVLCMNIRTIQGSLPRLINTHPSF
jgi:ADP-ribose pyrophosphatase YjhB (NUDIX family)